MKVLLDENLPQQLRRMMPGHEVYTVGYMRWFGTKNGELIQLAEHSGFDVLITLDSSIRHQQNFRSMKISLVTLGARSNRMRDIEPLVVGLMDVLRDIQPGSAVHV